MTSIDANIAAAGLFRINLEDGRIGSLDRLGEEAPEAPYCAPGFLDIQVNGFAGVDFSAPELDVDAVAHAVSAIRATGVTSFCPTLITNTLECLERNFRVLEAARRSLPAFAQSAVCYHLEGPYLSAGPSHGAHDSALIRPPDWEEFARLQRAAGGNIGILTLAPERPGALDLIRRASQAGVLVALSHTDGLPEDIHNGVAAGARLSTHLGNGCPQMVHRHQTPIWAQLALDGLAASIICDGFHLPPDLVSVIYKVKGPGRCLLVTDAVHVATMPAGRYSFGGAPIELLPNGHVLTGDGRCMAGSSLCMNRAIPIFMRFSGASLREALLAATRAPARLLRKDSLCDEVRTGAPANLVVFRPDAEAFAIQRVIVGGEEVRL